MPRLCPSRCYSVNCYKCYKNGYSKNRYKPLQIVTNRNKPVTPRTVMNRYKQLQTVTNHLRPKPLQIVTLAVRYYGIAVSTVTAHSITTSDTLSQCLLEFNLEHYELLS